MAAVAIASLGVLYPRQAHLFLRQDDALVFAGRVVGLTFADRRSILPDLSAIFRVLDEQLFYFAIP